MDNQGNKKRVYTIISTIVAVAILAAAAVFVITLFGATNEEPEALFSENGVEFTGQYGETYAYSDIENVSLEDTIPAVGEKLNGAGLGDVKKGDWNVEGMGKCRLFVMAPAGPYVVIDTKSGYVIISFKDAEKTKELYESLREKI